MSLRKLSPGTKGRNASQARTSLQAKLGGTEGAPATAHTMTDMMSSFALVPVMCRLGNELLRHASYFLIQFQDKIRVVSLSEKMCLLPQNKTLPRESLLKSHS